MKRNQSGNVISSTSKRKKKRKKEEGLDLKFIMTPAAKMDGNRRPCSNGDKLRCISTCYESDSREKLVLTLARKDLRRRTAKIKCLRKPLHTASWNSALFLSRNSFSGVIQQAVLDRRDWLTAASKGCTLQLRALMWVSGDYPAYEQRWRLSSGIMKWLTARSPCAWYSITEIAA